MALRLRVSSGQGELTANSDSLEVTELNAVLANWRWQCDQYPELLPERARMAAINWKDLWLENALDPAIEVIALRVNGIDGVVGLAKLELDGRTTTGQSCVSIILLAKAPQHFARQPIQGVGECLVLAAIALSKESNMCGRVRIPEALKGTVNKPHENPSALYKRLGFVLSANARVDVEYEDLEISAESAETLLRSIS